MLSFIYFIRMFCKSIQFHPIVIVLSFSLSKCQLLPGLVHSFHAIFDWRPALILSSFISAFDKFLKIFTSHCSSLFSLLSAMLMLYSVRPTGQYLLVGRRRVSSYLRTAFGQYLVALSSPVASIIKRAYIAS